MSEHMPAEIRIGGSLPAGCLRDLWRAAEQDGAGPDWGQEFPGFEAFQKQAQSLTGTPLVLCNDEARYGELPELIAFCRRHDLAFVHHGDAKYEYDGELGWWRPGMEGPAYTPATQDGKATVRVEDLAALLARPDCAVKQVREFLKRRTPIEVPPFIVITPATEEAP